MLSVERLTASYGPAQVLFDITFSVGAGEVVTLLGRNGMGKTTTIFALMGLVPPQSGAATFDGVSLVGLPPYRIAQAGLGLVPEGRQIFPTLTVEENLVATGASRFGTPRWTLPRIYEFFPSLAAHLSHGEKRALELAIALAMQPKLLLLDEPMAGTGHEESARLVAVLQRLKGRFSMLLVEHDMNAVFALADRISVLTYGRILASGAPAAVRADPAVVTAYLGDELE